MRVKALQETDYSCGPATLLAAARMLGQKTTERDLRSVCNANTAHGTYPFDMLKAAAVANIPLVHLTEVGPVEFDRWRRNYFLCLLISNGPNYGHWVLSVPTRSPLVILDDPWEKQYLSLTHEQLDDCWLWNFEGKCATKRCAILINRPVPPECLKELEEISIEPWPYPPLAEFPDDYVWTPRATSVRKRA